MHLSSTASQLTGDASKTESCATFKSTRMPTRATSKTASSCWNWPVMPTNSSSSRSQGRSAGCSHSWSQVRRGRKASSRSTYGNPST